MNFETLAKLPIFKEIKNLTREEWLNLVADRYLWPLIQSKGGKRPPKVRLSVGFPKGSRGGKHAIGQCWPEEASTDETFEIFSSPEQGDVMTIETLLHELIHASAGLKAKHSGEFKRLALAVGFLPPMKTTPPSDELKLQIMQWLDVLPPFPGAAMCVGKVGKVKPGSRLIKVWCAECDYTIRVAQKWIDVAIPTCPNWDCEGNTMQVER